MTIDQVDKRPLLKQPTFYFVTIAFAIFIYAQWPKTNLDSHIVQIANSEYQIDFIKKVKIKKIEDKGIWLYRSSVSGVKFAVRYQEMSPNITQQQLQDLALISFDKNNESFERVASEPTQYEKGYFWSVSDEKGRVRESLWVLADNGWMEIITVYDLNKKGHEDLAFNFSETLIKTK
ncbi:MAG: hypothetical protein HRU38_17785 [Saccharospirillaceae bacterium]|nr:hypothetical protein [Pseudomonadales bacterium]NRB80490.1 hypothetical protein [Saccharospirillaceae bacterium]